MPRSNLGVPSIADRVSRALLTSALLWSLAVALAVWMSVRYEMGELADENLQATAIELAALFPAFVPATEVVPGQTAAPPAAPADDPIELGWQLVRHDGTHAVVLEARSRHAPAAPWFATPAAGLTDIDGWRVHGAALGSGGRMLYVAQRNDEREEEALETAFGAAAGALAISLLAQLWLRARLASELQPLQRLSARLARLDPGGDPLVLGPAERAELEPVHDAIDALAERLQQRLERERAFSAHAAHALRTPLAGIDAQLALALRGAPAELAQPLQRARQAAAKLQQVVVALLALFRSAEGLHRQPASLGELAQRLPGAGLELDIRDATLTAVDPDLVFAALANLLDNAARHGARRVVIEGVGPEVVRVSDDGPGSSATQRQRLRQALASRGGSRQIGLGLMLADMVARAHGGSLRLPDSERGMIVELHLGPGPWPG